MDLLHLFALSEIGFGKNPGRLDFEVIRWLDRGDRRIVEGHDGQTLVAASEGISGMDVGVARDAQHGGVGLARNGGGSLLADLTHPDALVPGGELVGAVDFAVAGAAEEGGVRAAEEYCRRALAGVAPPRRHTPGVFRFSVYPCPRPGHSTARELLTFSL